MSVQCHWAYCLNCNVGPFCDNGLVVNITVFQWVFVSWGHIYEISYDNLTIILR